MDPDTARRGRKTIWRTVIIVAVVLGLVAVAVPTLASQITHYAQQAVRSELASQADSSTDHEAPTLSLRGNVLTISGGNTVTIPVSQNVTRETQEYTTSVTNSGLTLITTEVNSTNVVNITLGTLDSQAKTSLGGTIAGNVLYLQSADASNPGVITVDAQTFAGIKTFQGAIIASGGIGINTTPSGALVDVVIANPNDIGMRMIGATGQIGDMMVFGNDTYDRVTYINEFGELRVVAGKTNTVAVRIKQRNGSQTGDLTQWADISNNVLTVIDAQGNVGVGTGNPNNKVEINSSVSGLSGLRLTQVTSASSAGASNGKVLTVNASGDLVLVNDATSGASCSATSSFACNSGNTLGAPLTLGTTDAQGLTFITGNTSRVTIAATGLTTFTGAALFQNVSDSLTSFVIADTSGDELLVADTINSLVNIGGGAVDPDATPGLLVLDYKNTSGDPGGTNGGMYYNSNTGKFRCYEAGQWKNCLGMSQSISLNGTNGNGNASRWTDMPAALTEIFANVTGVNTPSSRTRYDLSSATQARLVANVNTIGAAAAELRVQYSTDLVSWNYLDGGTGPSVGIGTNSIKTSSWVTIVAGAKSDVYLRLVGVSGDGALDPEFGLIQLQVR